MIYELAHRVKERMPGVFEAAEAMAAVVFRMRYRRAIAQAEAEIGKRWDAAQPLRVRPATTADAEALAAFFAAQSDEAFAHFRPHPFDAETLRTMVGRGNWLMLVAEADGIVGYGFMRSYVHGVGYRGYMVDEAHRGQGIGKQIGYALNILGTRLGLEMYKSIHAENIASLRLTESVCRIEKLQELNDGDTLYKCYDIQETV